MPTRTAPSLESVLGELLEAAIESVDVVRSPYSTSYPIDDVTVRMVDGSELMLVRKDLAWTSLLPPARRAKPDFLYDPRREMRIYTDVLPGAPYGPARCVGIVDQPEAGRSWLFLEQLGGVELFQVGDLARWEATARWIARFHVGCADRSEALLAAGVPMLIHDWRWLQRWADRAVAGAGRDTARALRHLRARAAALWARLADQPTTVVHGELYASNVIVGGVGRGTRVSPIDWEMAAVAPGLVDLAALTAGSWAPRDRQALEVAYAGAAGRRIDAAFVSQLDACRLALCIQWLGWRPRWRAPAAHAHDWLSEALALVEQLEL